MRQGMDEIRVQSESPTASVFDFSPNTRFIHSYLQLGLMPHKGTGVNTLF